jgi:hypothetical protein
MESKLEYLEDERWWKHIENKQSQSSQGSPTEDEEHVSQAVYRICCGERAKSCGSCAGEDRESRRSIA